MDFLQEKPKYTSKNNWKPLFPADLFHPVEPGQRVLIVEVTRRRDDFMDSVGGTPEFML